MTIQWDSRYAHRTGQMRASVIRETLKLAQQPGIISFAGGLPAPDLFPIAAVQEAAVRVLKEQGQHALQYSTTEGHPPLRRFIAEQIAQHGIEVTEDNVLITSGSQQGLDLIGRVFLNPGDCVLVERPTFLGTLQTFNGYQAAYLGVDSDDEGVITSQLEKALEDAPKFMYIQPNFQTGPR